MKIFGLTTKWLLNKDTLFFWQLLFLICDSTQSLIENDRREAFYLLVKEYSNLYVVSIGSMSSYRYYFKSLAINEVVNLDRVIVRDRSIGGRDSDLYRCWLKTCSKYDSVIVMVMTHTCFTQI